MESKSNLVITVFVFFSVWVFFHKLSRITGMQGEEEGISLTPHYHFHPLPNQPGDYCRELTSAHSLQPDSNQEPLVSQRKSLTTKLRALTRNYVWKIRQNYVTNITLELRQEVTLDLRQETKYKTMQTGTKRYVIIT